MNYSPVENSREKEIRKVLNRLGEVIISGPSPEGLYTTEIKEKECRKGAGSS